MQRESLNPVYHLSLQESSGNQGLAMFQILRVPWGGRGNSSNQKSLKFSRTKASSMLALTECLVIHEGKE